LLPFAASNSGIYVKSLLLGVVTLVVSAIVYLLVLFNVLIRRYPPPPGVEVGLDLGSLVFRPSSGSSP
jgi:hypothetical protein